MLFRCSRTTAEILATFDPDMTSTASPQLQQYSRHDTLGNKPSELNIRMPALFAGAPPEEFRRGITSETAHQGPIHAQ
jgi:hypothetical protein